VTVSSQQARYLIARDGDNVTITCTRSNGTHPEWSFILQDENYYSYTQNVTILNNMGFSFYDSGSTVDGLQEFSVIINVSKQLNNTRIRCAAREREESDPVFNSFTDIITIEKGKHNSVPY
jgi:hypothetical protein